MNKLFFFYSNYSARQCDECCFMSFKIQVFKLRRMQMSHLLWKQYPRQNKQWNLLLVSSLLKNMLLHCWHLTEENINFKINTISQILKKLYLIVIFSRFTSAATINTNKAAVHQMIFQLPAEPATDTGLFYFVNSSYLCLIPLVKKVTNWIG